MPTGPAVTLTVANATAFGPDGTSDGDNPGMASRVLRGGGAWDSSWYATAEFGHMQSGTGILLDIGHAVTVNSVGLVLGSAAGADVQVRLGDSRPGVHVDGSEHVERPRHAAFAAELPGERAIRADLVHQASGQIPGKYQVSLYKATVDGHANQLATRCQ